MRLYGAIQAFRENKYPDNAQIDETLAYVIQHSPVDESRLSSEGRKLIHDVRDILETVCSICFIRTSRLTWVFLISIGTPSRGGKECR